MALDTLFNDRKRVLDCEIQDATGLNDFQKLPLDNGLFIPQVGIERFRIPLNYRHADGTVMNHDTHASMLVSLEAHKTGVNMSRFCAILQEEASKNPVDRKFLKQVLLRFRSELRDYEYEPLIAEASLVLAFHYPIKQASLKSTNWGWQYYPVELKARQQGPDEALFYQLKLVYEYSSTCPCSLSMAKQYEQDYRAGRTDEGSGIAVAHGQRSQATCEISLNIDEEFHIEDLVAHLRTALPTETQSLVKRKDEQAFAILNGEHPMFVEHASRRLSVVLDDDPRILDWHAKVEHFESLHSHNAVAMIAKEKK